MQMQYTWYVLLLLVAAGIAVSLALYTWRRPTIAGTTAATYLLLALATWCVAYAFQLGSPDLPAKIFWNKMRYVGIAVIPIAWLVVAMRFTSPGKWLTGQQLAWLAVEPTITVLLAWTNPWHGLMWRGYALDSRGPLTVLVPTYGPWLWVNVAYSYLLIAVGTYQFIVGLWRSSTPYRTQIAFILAGAFVPWIANILFLFNLGPVPNVDFTPFAFTFTGIVVAGGLLRFQLLDLVPLARDTIVETMSDGVIVLDAANRIVDLNMAAQRLIGRTSRELIGREAARVLSHWPNIAANNYNGRELHTELIVREGGVQRCYDVSVSPLFGDAKHLAGRLILLRDVTEHKRVQEALRRRAKELHTLHAISLDISAPNDLPTLLHTIVERAAQLLDAPGGGLYLCDPERQEVRCVVSYNTPRDYTGTVLRYGEGSAGIVAQTGKPLIIDDYRTWPGRAAVYEEEQPFTSVLSAPMTWQGQVTGVIHVLHDAEIRRFTQADLELLSLFASQAAIAVENARLLEAEREQRKEAESHATELRERERYLALLNDITLAAIETSDFQTMLQTLADRLGELIDADGCYITLWDEARQMAIPAAAYGELREMYSTIRVEPGEVTMTESVLRAGHVLVAEDVFNTPYLSPRIAAMFPARSLLGLPLIADGQKLGAALIAFNQPHQFTPDEIARGEQAARQIALAIAKAHALEAERQRADELDALRDIIADILTEHELPNLLRTLLERAVALLNATGGDLGLYDEEAQELVIIVSHNMGKDYAGTRMVLGEGAMGQVMQTGKPVLIDDYTTWEQRSPQYADGPWHAVMAAPLISGGRLIGALGIVDSDPRRKFTPSDLRLLGLLADQAAIVVEKARLLKEAQVRARRQAALVRLSADLATTLDEEEICHRVVQQLHDTLGYANQGIFLVDETTGERVCCAYIGWPDAPADWRIPPGQGLTERPLLDGQLHYTPDVTQEPAYVPGLGTGAEVDVPIYVGDKVVGVLVVESQEPNAFGPEDFEVLKAAANQAGIAMSNARLLQISQRRAQEAETLRQAGAVVAATLQQDEAIQRILEQLELVVPYDSASVQLLREGYVEIVGGRGWADPTAVVGLRFPVPGDNPNTVVIQERRPYILNDAPAAHAPFREDPHSHIRSWLGVPLIVGDRVIGMLTVDSKQPGHFTPDHARLITAFANQVAITLENARLFAEVEQRVRELSIMLETARVVSSILHLEEVLPIIARQMAQAIGVSGCTLSRWDREADAVVTWVEWRGDWGEYSSKLGIAYSLKEYPATRAVLEKRHPVVIRVSDPEADPAEVALMREQNILTLLMLPLTIGDRVIGLVELDDKVREREFTSDQIRLSQALADHAAIAIENARLFEAERKHSRELEALHEASLHLTSKLELQSVLEAILNYALKLAAATDAHIFLYDGERLSFGAALWADGREESPYIEPRPEGLTYTVARTGKRIVVDDVNRHSLFKDWPWGGAIAGLPLRIGGQVCGVMNVAFDRPHTFEEDELRVLELLADQAAIAIRNAQLHAEVRVLAITDSLTGFYNRRGLFELGRREIERARRFGRPLSAIMLDLDHFKLVNDTYGHHIGDQVLAELAACCRQALRDVDLLGRYGGEEFAFLLPETGVAAAQPVAERLRQHVERSLMNTDRGPISITISLGIAQLDETCPDLETLLERADQALYVAKRSGRNQVRVWQANDQDVP